MRENLKLRVEELELALDHAINAAAMADFIMRRGETFNDNWRAGFEKDMAIAKAARSTNSEKS